MRISMKRVFRIPASCRPGLGFGRHSQTNPMDLCEPPTTVPNPSKSIIAPRVIIHWPLLSPFGELNKCRRRYGWRDRQWNDWTLSYARIARPYVQLADNAAGQQNPVIRLLLLLIVLKVYVRAWKQKCIPAASDAKRALLTWNKKHLNSDPGRLSKLMSNEKECQFRKVPIRSLSKNVLCGTACKLLLFKMYCCAIRNNKL